MRNSMQRVGRHFLRHEFDCPCGVCLNTPVDSALIQMLDEIRDFYGTPLVVTSGYRCPAHNATVKGASPRSYHQWGMAADFYVVGIHPAELLSHVRIRYGKTSGIGAYSNRIHLDSRGSMAYWDKR